MSEVVDIGVATIEKMGADIIKLSFKTNQLIELEDAFKIDDVFAELAEGESVYSLVYAVGIHSSMSNEAQNFLSKNGDMAIKIKGTAIVLTNLPVRILARFFIRFHRPVYETKIFGSEQEALLWFDNSRELSSDFKS